MKGIARHCGERKPASAIEEFKTWKGDLGLLEGLKKEANRCPAPHFYGPKLRRRIVANAQALRAVLAEAGIKYSSWDPVVKVLENLQFIFSTKNPDFFLQKFYPWHLHKVSVWRWAAPYGLEYEIWKKRKSAWTVEDVIACKTPTFNTLEDRYCRTKGRAVKEPQLFFFVPALALYTKALCGSPQWAWIGRWLKEEMSIECPKVYQWWKDNCGVMDEQRYRNLLPHLSDALVLSLHTCCAAINDKGRERKFRKLLLKDYPFLKHYFREQEVGTLLQGLKKKMTRRKRIELKRLKK